MVVGAAIASKAEIEPAPYYKNTAFKPYLHIASGGWEPGRPPGSFREKIVFCNCDYPDQHEGNRQLKFGVSSKEITWE